MPVIGNVYLLSTITPAPRLMHDIKLPGCFVSDELLAKVYSERVDEPSRTCRSAGGDVQGHRGGRRGYRRRPRLRDVRSKSCNGPPRSAPTGSSTKTIFAGPRKMRSIFTMRPARESRSSRYPKKFKQTILQLFPPGHPGPRALGFSRVQKDDGCSGG